MDRRSLLRNALALAAGLPVAGALLPTSGDPDPDDPTLGTLFDDPVATAADEPARFYTSNPPLVPETGYVEVESYGVIHRVPCYRYGNEISVSIYPLPGRGRIV